VSAREKALVGGDDVHVIAGHPRRLDAAELSRDTPVAGRKADRGINPEWLIAQTRSPSTTDGRDIVEL